MAKRDCEVIAAVQELRRKHTSGEVHIMPPQGPAPANRSRFSRHLTIVVGADTQLTLERSGQRTSHQEGSEPSSSRSPRLPDTFSSESSSQTQTPRLPKSDEFQLSHKPRYLPSLQRKRPSKSLGPNMGRMGSHASGDVVLARDAHKHNSVGRRTSRLASVSSARGDSVSTACASTRASSGSPSDFDAGIRTSRDGRNGKCTRELLSEALPAKRSFARGKTSEDLDREFEEIFDNAPSTLGTPARTDESLDRWLTHDSLDQYLPQTCDPSQPTTGANDSSPGTEAFGLYAQHVLRAQTARHTFSSENSHMSASSENSLMEGDAHAETIDQRTEGPVRARALAVGIGRVRASLAKVRANQLLAPTGDVRYDLESERS